MLYMLGTFRWLVCGINVSDRTFHSSPFGLENLVEPPVLLSKFMKGYSCYWVSTHNTWNRNVRFLTDTDIFQLLLVVVVFECMAFLSTHHSNHSSMLRLPHIYPRFTRIQPLSVLICLIFLSYLTVLETCTACILIFCNGYQNPRPVEHAVTSTACAYIVPCLAMFSLGGVLAGSMSATWILLASAQL